jgi:hypothetical protein
VPRAFSIQQLHASAATPLVMTEEPGDFVGLLRRLSLYSTYLTECYRYLESWNYSPEWNPALSRLYGRAQNRDDFLGFGKNGLPNHDQMGLFPMFVDSKGREYFEVPDREGLAYTMRIPRHQTRANRDLDFPQPYEKIVLRPCGVPVFGFFWDDSSRDIRSISESQELFRIRVGTLANFESASKIYGQAIRATLIDTEGFRDASCLVRIEPHDEREFSQAFRPLQVLREEWNINITDMIKKIKDQSYRLDHVRVQHFFAYMQTEWAHAQKKWTNAKTFSSPLQ